MWQKKTNMPRYTYFCDSCYKTWDDRQPMGFIPSQCKYCDAKNIDRVPSSFIKIAKEAIEKDRKTGEVTKEYIEAAREDLRDMKGELRTKEHQPDD